MTKEQKMYYDLGKFEILMIYKRATDIKFGEEENVKATIELNKMLRIGDHVST